MKNIILLLVGLIVGAVGGYGVAHYTTAPAVKELKFATPFQAVLLNGGLVYYGKLSGVGTDYPVMTDVYYIQHVVNPQTKQESNVLVRRGKELHGPDKMYLNAKQIIFIEPVSPSSKVAQLIAESPSQ